MSEQPPGPQQRVALKIDEAMEGGVYANIMSVWHSPYEFTLDFSVSSPAVPGEDAAGNQTVDVPARVVARVKIPPAVIFAVIRTLNERMTQYEQEFGPIREPGQGPDQPLYPPDA